jgi:hypothetical protein
MPGSYIHTLGYFSGFWARRTTPDRVLKILAGGYFDIKRGHSALQVSLSGSLDIWAMWEYRRVRLCGNRYNGFIPAGEGLPDGVVRLFRKVLTMWGEIRKSCQPFWATFGIVNHFG